MASRTLRFELTLTFMIPALLGTLAQAQGGPALPGPSGAPKIGPPIDVPGRTPPIGGPVVLEPPSTNPPAVPRDAREPLQGQVARGLGPRRTFTQRCPPSEPGQYSRFGTITGRLQKGSTLVMTGECFGSQAVSLSFVVYVNQGASSFFMPNENDGSANPGFATFGLHSSRWTPTTIEFPVIYSPDPSQQPIVPPKVVRLELRTKNGVNFRASLSQQDIDTLNSGGTLTNPPSNP
jgi:hypothetical protein